MQGQRAVGGNHRLAHAAMVGVEVAQDVIQHRAIIQRYFGVFRDNTGMAQEGLAKRAQALAAGIDRAEGFAEEQQGFEAFFHQVFGGGGGGLGIIEADDIAGEFRNFAIDKHRLLQAVEAVLAHPDGVDHDPLHLIAAQQVEIVQLLVQLIVGITYQQGKSFFATGGFNAAEHVDGVGVGDIGDDQADQPGAAMLQAAGHQAGTIIELGNGFFNAPQQIVGKQMLLAVQIA